MSEQKPIGEAVRDALQAVFNEYPMDGKGAAYLGDYILITEQTTSDQTILRIITSDELSPWKRAGLLQWTLNDDIAESAGSYAWSLSFRGDEGEPDGTSA